MKGTQWELREKREGTDEVYTGTSFYPLPALLAVAFPVRHSLPGSMLKK